MPAILHGIAIAIVNKFFFFCQSEKLKREMKKIKKIININAGYITRMANILVSNFQTKLIGITILESYQKV